MKGPRLPNKKQSSSKTKYFHDEENSYKKLFEINSVQNEFYLGYE